jgi:hypothetical protein
MWMVVLLVLASISVAVAQDEASPRFDSPKATMKTMLSFIKEGQIERLPQCFVPPQTDDQRNLLAYGMSDDVYIPALHKALVAKFDEEASPFGKTLLAFDQQLQLIDSMEESTDGVNGRLAPKGFPQAGIALVKVQNDWKITIQPGVLLRPLPPQRLATAQALRAAYLDTIKEVESGKHASAGDAMAALETRRQAALQQQ